MAAAIETEASFSSSFSGEEKGGVTDTSPSPSPSPSPSAPPFRIIVVGGGLLGLTAAHMLAKAGLDFVVLEQHADLLPEIGSLLSLLPPTFRVLDQLGLLDAVGPVLGRHDRSVFMSALDASVWREESRLTKLIETNHGHGIRVTHRPDFIRVLYESLPAAARARVRTGRRVARVEVTADGVAVHCADGGVERGAMVLGADGVHSRTRQAMQSLAAGGPGDEDRPSPFVTTYRALLGNVGAPLPGLPPGSNYEGAADGVSTQVLTATGRAWFAVYEALEGGPTPRRRRWTAADADAVLARWGHLYAAPGYTVNQIRALADASGDGPLGLISLEEGLLDTWWWRRIVLVGDAVRKLEPHAGLGYNAGVSDLTELINGLRALTAASTSPAPPPTTADLEALFAAYQARRAGDSPALTSMSARRARLCAWLGPHHWLVARFAVPWLPLARRAAERVLGPLLARAPVLAWLPERRLPARAVPYLHHPRLGGDDGNDNDNNNSSKRSSVVAATPLLLPQLPLFAGAVVFATLATVGVRFYRRV